MPCKMRRSEHREPVLWEMILVGYKEKSLARSLLWDVQPPLIEENKSLFSFSCPSVTFHHGQNPQEEEAMRGLEFLEVP